MAQSPLSARITTAFGLVVALSTLAAPLALAEPGPTPTPTPGAGAASGTPSPVAAAGTPEAAAPSSATASASAEASQQTPTPEVDATVPASAPASPEPSSTASSEQPSPAQPTGGQSSTPQPPSSPAPTAAAPSTATASPRITPRAASPLVTITAPATVAVCQPVTVTGTAPASTAVSIDHSFNAGSWVNPAARVTTDANGRFSVTLQNDECYLGSFRVRARVARIATAPVAAYTRTGTTPIYSISVTQQGYTGVGYYRPWGTITVRGKIYVPTTTPITLWRMTASRTSPVKLATTMTDAQGNYSFAMPFPAANDGYVYVDSGRNLAAQRSAVVRVLSRTAGVGMSAPASLDATTTGHLNGTTTPRLTSPRPLRVWVLKGSTWKLAGTGSTSATGTWRLPFTEAVWNDMPGSYKVRVAMQQPDGSWIWSMTRTVKRPAGLKAVVRATTSADVAKTYRAGCPVGPASLRTVEMNHIGYDGRMKRGVLVVRADLADNVVRAFTRGTTQGQFPIKSMLNPNVWDGNDVKMMAAGNTSAFNCRRVTGNPYAMSPHSYGKAIDVNTIENPYRDPNGVWYPSAKYASYRPASVTGLLVATSGLTVGLRNEGYAWFTGWDWQHFEA